MSGRSRALLVATYVALLLLGLAIGVWTAFLVPQRIFGGVEGLAVALAFTANLLACWLGGVGAGSPPAAAMPGLGWMVVAFLAGVRRPEGDLVITGAIKGDPGVGKVGTWFYVLGLAGMVAGVVLAGRRRRQAEPE